MAELPHIGQHCGATLCNQLDFLPVNCDACSGTFCINHFTYDAHECKNAYQKNVQVPVCPLCMKPVPTPRGIAPDIQVNEHIQNNCSLNTKKKIFNNRCTLQGCKKKELIPVLCVSCKQNFCLGHRHEKDHRCTGKPNGASSTSNAGKAALARNMNSCSSQARTKQVQSDEAMAKALADSLNDTHLSPEERDRRLAEDLQRQEYQEQNGRGRGRSTGSNNDRCTMS